MTRRHMLLPPSMENIIKKDIKNGPFEELSGPPGAE